MSVTGPSVVHVTSVCYVCFDKYSTLSECCLSGADWCIKVSAMCYHVYVIMHVKDPQICITRVGISSGIWLLSVHYRLHLQNEDVVMMRANQITLQVSLAVPSGRFTMLIFHKIRQHIRTHVKTAPQWSSGRFALCMGGCRFNSQLGHTK